MADTPVTPPGGPTPGDHGSGHDHGHETGPMAQLWMAMSGASAGHHEEIPGADAKSLSVGHEPDKFDARTIIYVPIVVAITLVFTYLLVQGAFLFVNGKESAQLPEVTTDSTDPTVIEQVQQENNVRVKPWNERSGRMRNWTAEPVAKSTPNDQPLPPSPQPQLEANRQVDLTRLDVNGKPVTDPPFMRSMPSQGDNNAPVLYPEDLRPANYTDPWHGNAKLLAEPMWVKGHEGKLAVVPIDEMIHLVAHGEYKDVLKVAEKKADLRSGTLGKPKMSSGGVTGPVPGAVKTVDHHDH